MQSVQSDRIDVLGVELEWKLRLEETGGKYCVLGATIESSVGVPPHQHPDQEAFFVLEGRPEFALEESGELAWKTVSPGDLVKIPPDVMHGFRNESGETVRLLIMCTAGLARFFEEAGTPLVEGERAGADLSAEAIGRVIGIAQKHGQRFPLPAQPN
jgi:quercetin dioxygenase-like cupin family protein